MAKRAPEGSCTEIAVRLRPFDDPCVEDDAKLTILEEIEDSIQQNEPSKADTQVSFKHTFSARILTP